MVVYVIGNSIITKLVVFLCINITFHIQGSLQWQTYLYFCLQHYYIMQFIFNEQIVFLIIRIIHLYRFIYLQYLYVDYFLQMMHFG